MTQRLLPLYIAAFLQGIPFWYATEKLFMVSIGFDTTSIGLMVAIMSVVMLAVETPSGVLADRWSRKGVMILGCIALILSSIIGALSYSEPVFIISAIFWGIYAALYSGTYDAVIYDTTIEEYGHSNNFQKYLGRFKAVEGISFVVGALSGGLIAGTIGMRYTFIISIPFLLIALIYLWKFKEPQLHKAEIAEPVYTHIRQTFADVLRNPVLLPVIVAIVGFGVLQETMFEFSQLWLIALATPVAMYGLASAAVFSSWTTGGLLAGRIKTRFSSSVLMVIILAMILTLIMTRNYVVVLFAQLMLAVSLVALGILLAKKMHDELPSRLRAGSSSVVGTLARIILIPGSLIFTSFANNNSIFAATYMMLGVAIVASIAFLSILPAKTSTE